MDVNNACVAHNNIYWHKVTYLTFQLRVLGVTLPTINGRAVNPTHSFGFEHRRYGEDSRENHWALKTTGTCGAVEC